MFSKRCTYSRKALDNFYNVLVRFRSRERLESWYAVLESKGTETLEKNLTLGQGAHGFWTLALFALKPIDSSDIEGDIRPTELELEFHWVKCRLGKSPLPIQSSPEQSCEHYNTKGNGDVMLNNSETDKLLSTGYRFTMTTTDPIRYPLPSRQLLQMQWLLHQVTAMSGGAEIGDDFDQGDDQEDAADEAEADQSLAWDESLISAAKTNEQSEPEHPSPPKGQQDGGHSA